MEDLEEFGETFWLFYDQPGDLFYQWCQNVTRQHVAYVYDVILGFIVARRKSP